MKIMRGWEGEGWRRTLLDELATMKMVRKKFKRKFF
jgi:hypothetical protein